MAVTDPWWFDEAACSGLDPNIFFEPISETRRPYPKDWPDRARAVCEGCPVRLECLADGIAERWGIWGGLTYRERRALLLASA